MNSKGEYRKKFLIAIIVLSMISLLALPAQSQTNWWDQVRAGITGRLTSQNFDINISIGNSAPNITRVFGPGSAVDPTESGLKAVQVYFIANDSDGYQNIDATTAVVNLTYTNSSGTIRRTNSSCVNIGNLDSKTLNISCSVGMWYFDPNATWTINTYIEDVSGARGSNITATFVYNPLAAFMIHPSALTFSSINPGSINTTSNNDPLVLNNTGNWHFDGKLLGNISLNGTDLTGEDNGAYALYSKNFTIGVDTGGSPVAECGIALNSTFLGNNQYVNITNATLPYGNLSAGSGAGQENLYACLTLAGSELISQAYSTSGPNSDGPWILKVRKDR